MSGNKIKRDLPNDEYQAAVGANSPSASNVFATIADLTSADIPHAVASGTNTYTVTVPGVTAYTDGDAYLIRFTNGSDADSTININGLGAKTLVKEFTQQLTGGDIIAGQELVLIYDGTNFQCIGVQPNQLFAYVTNDDSVAILKGQPVYAFGAAGNRMSVKLAANTSDATSAQTVGVVYSSSIAPNQRGFIITQGVISGVNTGAYTEGDQLYLGATAGTLTNVKPYAPNHLVYLGIVERANAGNGLIYVRTQNGYELDELHDVDLITTPPTDGQVLTYDSVTGLWRNESLPTDVNIYNSNGTLTGNRTVTMSGNTLNFSGGNVGINQPTPTVPLHIKGTAIPSTNEPLVRLEVSDAIGAYLGLDNASLTDGQFVPQMLGRQNATSSQPAIYVTGAIDVAQDSGTAPVTVFRSTLSSLASVVTRPIFQFKNWATDVMTILADGKVGIGITAPATPLHVRSTAVPSTGEPVARFDVSDGAGYLQVANGTSANGVFAPLIQGRQSGVSTQPALQTEGIIDVADDTGTTPITLFKARLNTLAQVVTRPVFQFSNWTLDIMTMLADGNVGIGTTTPTAKLEVNGPAFPGMESVGKFTVSDDASSSLQIKNGTNTPATFIPEISGTNSTNRTALAISGTATTDTGTEPVTVFQSYLASLAAVVTRPIFQWKNYTTNIMTILANGNVGVGTTTPSEKLEVSGKTKTTTFQMTTAPTAGYVLTSDASGNGSWAAPTSSSGRFGIADSNGVYTYYSDLQTAINAALGGQTVELFADITVGSNVSINLKNGVNINGNGHTYFYSNSLGNCFQDNGASVTCSINNLVISRTSSLSSGSNVLLTGASRINFTGSYFYRNVLTDNYACIEITGAARIFNAYCVTEFGRGIWLNNSGGSAISCYAQNIQGAFDAIVSSGGLTNCIGIASSTNGITTSGGTINNCTGVSTSGIGISAALAILNNCVGISSSGRATSISGNTVNNSTFRTASAVCFEGSNASLTTVNNCTILSVSGRAVNANNNTTFINCSITSQWANSGGYGIENPSRIFNCTISTQSTTTNALYSINNITARWTNCIFIGATTPVSATITQAITNTEDNQGNLLVN